MISGSRKALSDDPAPPVGFLSWQSFFLRHCPTTASMAFAVPTSIAHRERTVWGSSGGSSAKGLNIYLLSVVSVSPSPLLCCAALSPVIPAALLGLAGYHFSLLSSLLRTLFKESRRVHGHLTSVL